MRRKGFTLIELLAVIVILAIIALIATPMILGVIDDAKKGAFESSGYGMIESAEQGYMQKQLTAERPILTEYQYESGNQSTIQGNIDLNYKGNNPNSGTLLINETGKVALAIHNGIYCVKKEFEDTKVSTIKTLKEDCVVPNHQAVQDTTPSICFEFDSESGTILDYDSDNLECPSDVVIPNNINGVVVKTIGEYAFYENQLTSVIIPNSVTTIESEAFSENQLINVAIPNSVITIGYEAFFNNQLTNLTIPNSVITIGNYAFALNRLTSVIIPDSVTMIEYGAFYENQLTSVTIPNSITVIEWAVFANNQLTSVIIPNSVITIKSRAFSWNQLMSVTIPDSVIKIDTGVFESNQLTSVIIPNSVTQIFDKAFGSNYIPQGEAKIDNQFGNVMLGNDVFYNNGPSGNQTITPIYLR